MHFSKSVVFPAVVLTIASISIAAWYWRTADIEEVSETRPEIAPLTINATAPASTGLSVKDAVTELRPPQIKPSSSVLSDARQSVAATNDPGEILDQEALVLQESGIHADRLMDLFENDADLAAFLAKLDEEARADPVASELSSLYSEAFGESFESSNFHMDTLVCGRSVCVGSAAGMEEGADWEAALRQLGSAYGDGYESLVSTEVVRDGTSIYRFAVSTNSFMPTVQMTMPPGGVLFRSGDQANPPPAPTTPDGG